MSNLVPAVTVLDKGLDLQSPKIIAPAGTVLNTINYEQVDFQGQKRIDGYARYDGSIIPVLDDYAVVSTTEISQESETDTPVYIGGQFYGMLLNQITSTELHIAIINYNVVPTSGDIVKFGATEVGNVVSFVMGSESEITPEAHYETLLDYMNVIRGKKGGLPGPVAGLHWFRDRLYAVAELTTVYIESPNYLPTLGDTLSTSDEDAILLDVQEVDAGIVLTLSAMNAEAWQDTAIVITGPDGVVGTTTLDHEYLASASFFESRSEQQAIEEDGTISANWGWRFVHLGWRVMFENGLSLYGDIAALNQNRTGVGVQGPTDVSGDNGRPLALSQKVNIVGVPAQVNGWKSTQSSNSYSLNPADVASVDALYTYADAYVTWDASGTVQAPGSDMNNLQEYPPTATVEVEGV